MCIHVHHRDASVPVSTFLFTGGYVYKAAGQLDKSLVAFRRAVHVYRLGQFGPQCSACGHMIFAGGSYACLDCCVRVICDECYVDSFSTAPEMPGLLCHHSSRILRASVALDYQPHHP